MTDELFCPKHGYYPATARRCPYCAAEQGELPPAPSPLFPDSEESTQAPGASQGYTDDDETILPGQPARGSQTLEHEFGGGDYESTQPPVRRGRFLDEDETQLPERKRRHGFLEEEDETDVTVIDRQETGLIGWLIVKSSRSMRRGQILKIKPEAIYGRSNTKADIVINDEKISGIHARFKIKDDKFILVDLGSSNGTFVNGEQVVGNRELAQDDEIRMGETVFVLKTLS
jgi:hypothetical protein